MTFISKKSRLCSHTKPAVHRVSCKKIKIIVAQKIGTTYIIIRRVDKTFV